MFGDLRVVVYQSRESESREVEEMRKRIGVARTGS